MKYFRNWDEKQAWIRFAAADASGRGHETAVEHAKKADQMIEEFRSRVIDEKPDQPSQEV